MRASTGPPAVCPGGPGGSTVALRSTIAWLSARDGAAHLSNLIDIVDAICWLRVLLFDIKVEMSTEG